MPETFTKTRTNDGAKRGASRKLPKRPFIRTVLSGDDRLWVVGRSSIHNRGVFARRAIEPNEPVIDYVGELVTKDESDRRGDAAFARSLRTGGGSVYLFTLNKKFDIDGAFPWNPARLINHSCDPNCEVHIVKGRIWVVALKAIAEGEELSFNYGFDLEDFESHPCRCGTTRCVGFIAAEEYWPELEERKRGGKNGSGLPFGGSRWTDN